jgi:hypothetical protein
MFDENLDPQAVETALGAQSGRARVRRLRRMGCLILLPFWFALLATPCVLLYLATQGQIAVSLPGEPARELRIWVLSETDRRGVGISVPSVIAAAQNQKLCVQTDVRFLLWMGKGEASQYCECYARGTSGGWTPTDSRAGSCAP